MVARLGGEEPAVEARERGIVERLSEEPHAFAAPRLDERGTEERVDQAFGLARAHGLHELPGVRARHLMAERDAARRELGQHLLEVAELLARELRERHRQLPPLGILEEEAHRGGRRLLLAVSVVEEDLVEVRARTHDPRATRRGREAQHDGALLPRRRRPPTRRVAPHAPFRPPGAHTPPALAASGGPFSPRPRRPRPTSL